MFKVKTLFLQAQDFKSGKFPQQFAMSLLKDNEVSNEFCASELVFANGKCVKDRMSLMEKPVIAPVALTEAQSAACGGQKLQSLEIENAQLRAENQRVWARNRFLEKQAAAFETENEILKEQIQCTDDLLDDIAQYRADKTALKAIIAEAVQMLADPEITDGEIDEAVRLLKKAREI